MDENKELDELVKETLNLPPITGDMVKDYVDLINKEMAVTAAVWKEYHDIPDVEKNPLITNHMQTMVNMYSQLLAVADTFGNSEKLEKMLTEIEESEKNKSKEG